MTIITFSGKAGAGKNYSAKIFESMTEDTHELAYGNGVKSIASMMGWGGNKDYAGRKLLQSIGEAGRQYDKNIWVKLVIKQLELINGYNHDAMAYITDARFPNEIDLLKETFGADNVITILVKGRQYDMGELNNDVSETSIDNYDFDVVLDNGKSEKYLKQQISELILTKELY